MGDAGTKGARLERVEAVCYSGYRAGQSPAKRVYPSEAQVLADLQLLAGRFRHLRMYDCSPHCQLVLELIRREKLPFKVMIGAYLEAESSNPKRTLALCRTVPHVRLLDCRADGSAGVPQSKLDQRVPTADRFAEAKYQFGAAAKLF